MTIEQRDKRPEERQPLGTGIHAFVFFVASPFIRRGELGFAPKIQTPVFPVKCPSNFLTNPIEKLEFRNWVGIFLIAVGAVLVGLKRTTA